MSDTEETVSSVVDEPVVSAPEPVSSVDEEPAVTEVVEDVEPVSSVAEEPAVTEVVEDVEPEVPAAPVETEVPVSPSTEEVVENVKEMLTEPVVSSSGSTDLEERVKVL